MGIIMFVRKSLVLKVAFLILLLRCESMFIYSILNLKQYSYFMIKYLIFGASFHKKF